MHRFREATQRSSFGPCVFSPLDFSLSLWTQTDGTPRAQLFHPSWQTEVYFTPDGEVLRDTALGVGRHLRLLDASGVPTMLPASAVSAEFEGLDGRVWTFGLIADSSGGLLGRLAFFERLVRRLECMGSVSQLQLERVEPLEALDRHAHALSRSTSPGSFACRLSFSSSPARAVISARRSISATLQPSLAMALA